MCNPCYCDPTRNECGVSCNPIVDSDQDQSRADSDEKIVTEEAIFIRKIDLTDSHQQSARLAIATQEEQVLYSETVEDHQVLLAPSTAAPSSSVQEPNGFPVSSHTVPLSMMKQSPISYEFPPPKVEPTSLSIYEEELPSVPSFGSLHQCLSPKTADSTGTWSPLHTPQPPSQAPMIEPVPNSWPSDVIRLGFEILNQEDNATLI